MSLGTSAAMVASLVTWIDWVDFGVGPPPLGVLLFEQALARTSMVTPSRMEVHGRPPGRGRLCLIVLLSRSGFVCRILWRTGPRREPPTGSGSPCPRPAVPMARRVGVVVRPSPGPPEAAAP